MGVACTNVFDRKHSNLISTKFKKSSITNRLNEARNATITDKLKSDDDIKMIMTALTNHFILKSLDEDSRVVIAQGMKFYSIGAKEIIFQEGQPGLCFFILATGRLEVLINKVKKNLIYPGHGFGELALLDDRPRTATIKTAEKSEL